jgi:hypothetical protein
MAEKLSEIIKAANRGSTLSDSTVNGTSAPRYSLEQSLSAGDPHPHGQMVLYRTPGHNEDQGAATFIVLNVYLKSICRLLQTIELAKGQPGPGSKSY